MLYGSFGSCRVSQRKRQRKQRENETERQTDRQIDRQTETGRVRQRQAEEDRQKK